MTTDQGHNQAAAIDYRELRVFVSSRMAELASERRAIKAALEKLHIHAWVFEDPDGAGARPQSIQRTYLDEVNQADLYLGVFWRGYGEYTEDEYRHAISWNKPCLIYEKRADIEGQRDPQLQRLLDEIAAVKTGLTIKWFNTPEELAQSVERDVARWQAETVRARRAENVPMQAPPVKPDFVPRPDETTAIKALLLRPREAADTTLMVVALQGLGGSGKSVLAASIAHDPEVRAAFTDGILWATLGQTPNIAGVLEGWIRALGNHAFRFTTEDAARAELSTLVSPRRVLIVIDDAWDPAHVAPLLAAGARSAILITTRDAIVARTAGATGPNIVEIRGTERGQSLAILAGGPGRAMQGGDITQANAVADALGDLPLALSLAAAQAADGVTWNELIADLQTEIARLESLELPGADEITDPELRKKLSLLGSLNLSVARIPQLQRDRFERLGVLPDDTAVTPALAVTLWDVDERTARNDLRYLRGKALLLTGGALADGTPTYMLHDIVHDLASRLIAAAHGGSLADAHAAFIERLRQRLQSGQWHTVPNDGYIQERLVWHFERARREDLVHVLLREQTAAGENAWLTLREQMGQVAGYLADVRRGLALAVEGRGGDPTPVGLPEQVRYLLLLSTFHAFVPPPVLAHELEARGVWTLQVARSYALEVPDPARRVRSLTLLAENTSGAARAELLDEALAALRLISRNESETGAWLAPRLAAMGHHADALAIAQGLPGNQDRAIALAQIAQYFEASERTPVIEAGIEAALATGEIFAAAAIEALVPYLDEEQLDRVIGDARAMDDSVWRDGVLAILAPRLAELGRIDDAVALVGSIADRPSAAGAIAAIAPRIAEPERTAALRTALAAIREIDDAAWRKTLSGALDGFSDLQQSLFGVVFERQSWRASTLGELAPSLPPEMINEAQAIVESSPDGIFRVTGVAALAPSLAPDPRRRAIKAARLAAQSIDRPTDRAEALTALLRQVSEAEAEDRQGVATELLDTIKAIDFSFEGAERLAAAASALPAEMLDAALNLIEHLEVEHRAEPVDAFAPRLAAPGLLRAFRLSRAIQDGDAVRLTATTLAARLDDAARIAALADAKKIQNSHLRARAIEILAPGLPDGAFDDALAAAHELEDQSRTSLVEVALPALARRLDGPRRRALVTEIVESIAGMADGERAAWAIASITDLLEPEDYERLLQAAPTIAANSSPDLAEYERAVIEAALLAGLPAPARAATLEALLAMVPGMTDGSEQRDILTRAAQNAPDLAFPGIIEVAAAISDLVARATTFARLLSSAPEDLQVDLIHRIGVEIQALTETGEEQNYDSAEMIMARSIAYLQPQSAIDLLEGLRTDASRRIGIINLAPIMTDQDSDRLLDVARRIDDPDDRSLALAALAVTVAPERQPAIIEESLEAAIAANTDLHHDETLAPIADYLAQLPQANAVAIWQNIIATLQRLPRPTLVTKLRALAPVLEAVGDKRMIRETGDALSDVARWFP